MRPARRPARRTARRTAASWACTCVTLSPCRILALIPRLPPSSLAATPCLPPPQASSWGGWAEDMAVQAELERLQQELTPT